MTQSGGELDLMGSNSKSVGANTVWGRGELEGANSIGGESGGYQPKLKMENEFLLLTFEKIAAATRKSKT